MLATIINAAAIIAGSLIGLLGAGKITEKYKTIVYTSIGLITLVLGLGMALKTAEILFVIFSLILGGFLGTALGIEERIHNLGKKIGEKTGNSGSNFAAGFLNASVLFCVGAMAIIGSLKAGIDGDFTILLTKSVMDGFMAIMFSAVFGLGVLFSALSVFVYQGAITLLSGLVAP
ncbi:MAG: DUF554 domain-containing protein, partial [Spirochaetales bacterium]|nr:DUF554 domain-containing protein [Spirochaetales bacterium]